MVHEHILELKINALAFSEIRLLGFSRQFGSLRKLHILLKVG